MPSYYHSTSDEDTPTTSTTSSPSVHPSFHDIPKGPMTRARAKKTTTTGELIL